MERDCCAIFNALSHSTWTHVQQSKCWWPGDSAVYCTQLSASVKEWAVRNQVISAVAVHLCAKLLTAVHHPSYSPAGTNRAGGNDVSLKLQRPRMCQWN
jgi:hypothetical protein